MPRRESAAVRKALYDTSRRSGKVSSSRATRSKSSSRLNRSGSKGRKSRFPMLPAWASQAGGTAHLLGASRSAVQLSGQRGVDSGPRIIPEISGRDSATVDLSPSPRPAGGSVDGFPAGPPSPEPHPEPEVVLAPEAPVFPLGVNPYATLQSVTAAHKAQARDSRRQRKKQRRAAASRTASPRRAVSPGRAMVEEYLRGRSPSPPPLSRGGTANSLPSLQQATAARMSALRSPKHPLQQPAPRSKSAMPRKQRAGKPKTLLSPQSRAATATGASPGGAMVPPSSPIHMQPTSPGGYGSDASYSLDDEGGYAVSPDATQLRMREELGTASTSFTVAAIPPPLPYEDNAIAARLHKGELHPQLRAVMKAERRRVRVMGAEVQQWQQQRQHVAQLGQGLMAAQEEMAEDLRLQVAQAKQQHDAIVNAPQRSEDAKRLLRMRIERNFSSMVKRWMDAKTGWAIRRWTRYVKMHREYSAWADVVGPHACVIQRIYRSWRSRMIIRAAKEARVRAARQRSALGIQAAFRGMKGREIAEKRRVEKMTAMRLAASINIQRLMRAHIARKRVDRMCRGKLMVMLREMGLGSMSLLYKVLEQKSWPPEQLQLLELALEIVRATGKKGRGEFTFDVVMNVISSMVDVQAQREQAAKQALQDAENERWAREAMWGEEVWQRSMERNIRAKRKAEEEAAAAAKAAQDREDAEQAGILARREAVEKLAAEKHKIMRRDADRELGRKAKLLQKEKAAADYAALQARLREDKERKRQATLKARQNKKQAKQDAIIRKRNLMHMKKIKAIRKQQEAEERDRARKKRAADKKKAQQAKLRAEREKKEEKARMRAAMKARAHALKQKEAHKGKAGDYKFL